VRYTFLHPFPTRRSSDLLQGMGWDETEAEAPEGHRDILQSWIDAKLDVVVVRDTPYPGAEDINVPDCVAKHEDDVEECSGTPESDRKSTRLNSSHVSISY